MAIVATRQRNSKGKGNSRGNSGTAGDGQPAGGGGAQGTTNKRVARGQQAGRGAKSSRLKSLPADGVRLARVPLSDLVGEVPKVIVSVDGWECYGHRERIHIRPVASVGDNFTKACDVIELWARPLDGGCPAAYLDVRFCRKGEPVTAYVLCRFDPNKFHDGMCKLSIDGGGMEQCVSMGRRIPASFGEALLQRVFADVPVVMARRQMAT